MHLENQADALVGDKGKWVRRVERLRGQDWKNLVAEMRLQVLGDVAGIEGSRRSLCDWLDWMGFIDAGAVARLDRYIGYYEPYATSHEALDGDLDVQEETRQAAQALSQAVVALRGGRLKSLQSARARPRPK